MSKFTKQHYESVAEILSNAYIWNGCRSDFPNQYKDAAELIIRDFVRLFAADNPDYCGYCGTAKKDVEGPNCDARLQPFNGHSYVAGFNCEQFLAACGLDAKTAEPRNLGFHQ